jgi:hypothetical protein
MLFPKKNLLKPFTDSDWIYNVATVDKASDVLIITSSMAYSSGRIYIENIKPNTTYTFIMEIEGGMVTPKIELFADTTLITTLMNAGTTASPYVYTFTTTSNTNRMRLWLQNTGAGGIITYKRVQIAEGLETSFEPYQLAMKKNANKEVLISDMTGAGAHVYPYGNVIQVKEDVRLWGYQIYVGTPAGIYDSVIYEWNNGCIGDPIFREVIDCTANTMYTLSFKGTRLQAGKKYYIGRNDPQRNNSSNGTAGVNRKTGTPGVDYKYLTTLGGSQFYSPNIDFPSTWYYIFGLEVEKRFLKKANLVSDGALNPNPSSDAWTLRAGTTYKRTEERRTYFNSNQDYAGIQVILANIGLPDSLFQGKDITFGGNVHPMATVMFFYKKADGTATYIGVSKVTDNGARNITVPIGASECRLYVQSDTGGRGELWVEDAFVKFGSDKTYKAYNPVLKPATLLPKKNLIPDFYDSRWFDDATVASPTVSIYSDNPYGMRMDVPVSASGRLIWIPVESGKTYTFSFGKATGLYRIYRRKVNNHDASMCLTQDPNAGKPSTFSFTVDDTYNGFITIRLTYGAATSLWYENLQLEEGTATAFEKLMLTKLKPAILYPKKNFVLPYDAWTPEAAAGMTILEKSNRKIVINFNSVSQYVGLQMPIDMKQFDAFRGRTATFSGIITRNGGNSQVQLRFYGGPSGNTDFVLGNNPASSTKLVPADFTGVFLKIQSNIIGQTQIIVEDLQLEIGSQTPFEPYSLGMKQ